MIETIECAYFCWSIGLSEAASNGMGCSSSGNPADSFESTADTRDASAAHVSSRSCKNQFINIKMMLPLLLGRIRWARRVSAFFFVTQFISAIYLFGGANNFRMPPDAKSTQWTIEMCRWHLLQHTTARPPSAFCAYNNNLSLAVYTRSHAGLGAIRSGSECIGDEASADEQKWKWNNNIGISTFSMTWMFLC